MSLYHIMENLLNQRDIVVKDKKVDESGKEYYIINQKETRLAMEKARIVKENFKLWIWSDSDRRKNYVNKYNELFNSLVGRKYDGSHQTFEGMSSKIELKEHQKNAIARAKYGGNTLLAHCVGAGKSFEMFAAVMEKKRLGLINKACVVVPKSLTGQTAIEWQRLYPNAHILVATEKDFSKDNRKKFMARCTTGNYDSVIMSYEQFEKIQMSREYQENFFNDELERLSEAIAEAKDEDYSRATVKDLERIKKKLEARLQKLLDGGKQKDTSLEFEQFGFDYLVVDEAHNYKNGLVVTKMKNVAGVTTQAAQKSEDILMKCNWLNEKYGCKNILYATGTPVSNSMTELYIMKNYLRPDLLNKAGLQTFDDWAATFGEVVSQLELKPAGNGFRTKKRFAKFVNLPELMSMYKEFADIKNVDDLDLPIPKLETEKPQVIVAKPSEFQKEYMKTLAERSEAIQSGNVDPHIDNMLKITHEARLLGLDQRTISHEAGNNPTSKVNLCIEKVLEIYNREADKKGVQAIFCDIAINENDGRFSVYEYIKYELIRRGIPESEICFASDAKDIKGRNELFSQLRKGKKRIVIASTSKMGMGANIQNKLCAMHHLDIPWRPSDLEQRNGRILRQGNEYEMVGIYNYLTENTFDAYMMNIITTKQKFISQLMSGDTTARTCEDVDEMVITYSEMQALASGDPKIKERIELNNKISELRLLESAHRANAYKMQDLKKSLPREIERLEKNLQKAKKDKETALKYAKSDFEMTVKGRTYSAATSEHARHDADEAILKEALVIDVKSRNNNFEYIESDIGMYNGFEISVRAGKQGCVVSCNLYIKGELEYKAEAGLQDSSRNTQRIENLVTLEIDKRIKSIEERIKEKSNDLIVAERIANSVFDRAGELEEAIRKMEELDEYFTQKGDDLVMDDNENDENSESPKQEPQKPNNKNNDSTMSR